MPLIHNSPIPERHKKPMWRGCSGDAARRRDRHPVLGCNGASEMWTPCPALTGGTLPGHSRHQGAISLASSPLGIRQPTRSWVKMQAGVPALSPSLRMLLMAVSGFSRLVGP